MSEILSDVSGSSNPLTNVPVSSRSGIPVSSLEGPWRLRGSTHPNHQCWITIVGPTGQALLLVNEPGADPTHGQAIALGLLPRGAAKGSIISIVHHPDPKAWKPHWSFSLALEADKKAIRMSFQSGDGTEQDFWLKDI